MIVSRNGLESRGVRIGECTAWCAKDFANAQIFKRSRRYNGEDAGVKGVRGFRYVCCRIHAVILSFVVPRRLPEALIAGISLDAKKGSTLFEGVSTARHSQPTTVRGSTYASIPKAPNSRPRPDSLKPPNGASGSSYTPLMNTRPATMRSAIRLARVGSLELT